MLRFARIAIQVAAVVSRWWTLAFRSTRSINAENLFLRRQLALYIERGVKPRRIDSVTRIVLVILSRFFHWRDALVVVRPETMIRWHRAGWKLFWRLKSRPGRPPIPLKIQALIRRMGSENPAWGEQRACVFAFHDQRDRNFQTCPSNPSLCAIAKCPMPMSR